MRIRMIFMIIAVLLLVLLAGCANNTPDTEAPHGGTLYIKVNPEIAVSYDADGNVTAVTAVTEDAKSIVDSYQDFLGKNCTNVVSELVTKIGEAGYLSAEAEEVTITITFEEKSMIPNEEFLKEVEQEVQAVVAANLWQGTIVVEKPTLEPDAGQTDGTSTTPPVGPTGPTLPEGAELQGDGSYVLTEHLDDYYNAISDGKNPFYIRTTVYNRDGIPTSSTTILTKTNITVYYTEYYPNGNLRNYKRWSDSGVLTAEFTAFTDANAANGIHTSYDEHGNVIARSTTGNPDGSPDTSEMWDEDGAHIVDTLEVTPGTDGEVRIAERRYSYPDGGYLHETYDYEAGTWHSVSQRPNRTSDLICRIDDGEPIEGYLESTVDGILIRLEYRDGYKCKEIVDGATNVRGYKYRGTTCYYPNGQLQSDERYFYADGGRSYVELDENGNEIYSENTTNCN